MATSAIQDFLSDHDIDVTLVVFDKSAFIISRELLGEVESHIDEHYIEAGKVSRRQLEVERKPEQSLTVSEYEEPIIVETDAPSFLVHS